MANSKSALKRAQIGERNRLRNKAYKSAVKTLMKKYFTVVETYAANPNPELEKSAQDQMSEAYSKIDKAVKRGIIHPNNAARKKSQLARRFKSVNPQTA